MKIPQLWLVNIQCNAKENAGTVLLFAIHMTSSVAQVAARDIVSHVPQLVRLSRDASRESCVTIAQ